MAQSRYISACLNRLGATLNRAPSREADGNQEKRACLPLNGALRVCSQSTVASFDGRPDYVQVIRFHERPICLCIYALPLLEHFLKAPDHCFARLTGRTHIRLRPSQHLSHLC
jgi:hypothetical protein